MGQNKLMTGVALGALAGAILTMFDKTTRVQTGQCLKSMGTQTKGYISNPTQAIHDFRNQYERATNTLTQRTNDIVSFLDQMEGYLDTVEQQTEDQQEKLET
ncbi:hypothetical protein GLW08_15615 [Pontibacillus yanchengensis]|uniref:Uncharacterized protein n=2 Tax=Pontibacillus yanchengensis TaxID=462910 RepID=A0ACC7VH22_9BACI|nr:hypothetical protein [Pontibacillus yanchengensis]MYL34863.1 hypothetical protein [Pontibacillus yanchengensis]MYL54763.1 hypothetical protein [Pontibacillus yanchengensis]